MRAHGRRGVSLSRLQRTVGVAFAAGVALTSGAALAGCGSSSPTATIDNVKVERAIADSILTQDHAYALVSCPAKVPQQQGRRFKCTAKLTVGSYPVYVTETDGKGHVSYANRQPLVVLDTTRVEHSIAASILAQRNLRARVSCPSDVLQRKGLKFTCTANVRGRRYPFTVEETNSRGHVRYLGR